MEAKKKGEMLEGINIATQEVGNMTVDTIYVAPDAVSVILNNTKLTEAEQATAVDDLVDRTKDWLELESEKQTEKIEICMVQETVLKHLALSNIIREDCYSLNVGIRKDDGAVVVEAMYVHMNREERRSWMRKSEQIAKLKKGKASRTVTIERSKTDE